MAATFISTKRAMSPIGSTQRGLADLGAGPLAHPPYELFDLCQFRVAAVASIVVALIRPAEATCAILQS